MTPTWIDVWVGVFAFVVRVFRNRWYRSYFRLVEAFIGERCALCILLAEEEHALPAAALKAPGQGVHLRTPLKTLCVRHRNTIKAVVMDDSLLLPILKPVLKESFGDLSQPCKPAASKWNFWTHRSRVMCRWCAELSSEENFLCRALIRYLNDTEFWKALQNAPLLCLDHLEMCLNSENDGVGLERLRNDQRSKLNSLLNDLVRYEATGTLQESKIAALNWLADSASSSVNIDHNFACSADANAPLSGADANASDAEAQDEETARFENEKLRRKVSQLLIRLNDVEGRAASLHYQVSRLIEDNKRLEMGYTGASTQARGLESLVRDLRHEIKTLKQSSAHQKISAS